MGTPLQRGGDWAPGGRDFSRKSGRWQGEAIGLIRDGSFFPQDVTLTVTEDGDIISIVRDITRRKAAEEKLRFSSNHDALTGLYNRAYFDEELGRINLGRKFPAIIMVADVDRLKEFNDRFGHAIGDELIRRAAAVLKEAFRFEDIVARIGGDEFCALLPETGTRQPVKPFQGCVPYSPSRMEPPRPTVLASPWGWQQRRRQKNCIRCGDRQTRTCIGKKHSRMALRETTKRDQE